MLHLLISIFGAIIVTGGVRALISGRIPIIGRMEMSGKAARLIGILVAAGGVAVLWYSLPVVLAYLQ